MAIDPKLPIPVYFQLKTLLLEEILDGRYGPDGRLPTEHQLCERHGISGPPVTGGIRFWVRAATRPSGPGRSRGRTSGSPPRRRSSGRQFDGAATASAAWGAVAW